MVRKPRGYWKNPTNVRRELLAFVARHGVSGVMPTVTELREAGHGSLAIAIHKYHGDFREVAKRLHLTTAQKPKGYWQDFANVKREILTLISEQGEAGMMPTMAELREAGLGSLVSAIHEYHGDLHRVAKRLKLATPYKPKGYWKDFGNVRREVRRFIADHGNSGIMPTEGELRVAGHSSLTFAICEYHGDFRTVAGQLNLASKR